MPYLNKAQKKVFEENVAFFNSIGDFLNISLKAKASTRRGKPRIRLEVIYPNRTRVLVLSLFISDFSTHVTEDDIFKTLSILFCFEGGNRVPEFSEFFEDFQRFRNRSDLYNDLHDKLSIKHESQARIKI